jgi:hypothetical protein
VFQRHTGGGWANGLRDLRNSKSRQRNEGHGPDRCDGARASISRLLGPAAQNPRATAKYLPCRWQLRDVLQEPGPWRQEESPISQQPGAAAVAIGNQALGRKSQTTWRSEVNSNAGTDL